MLRNLDTDHKKEEFVVVLALRIQFSLGSRIPLSSLFGQCYNVFNSNVGYFMSSEPGLNKVFNKQINN